MGHLINIANLIANLCSTNSLGQILSESLPDVYEQFQKFKDTILQEINKAQEMLLVCRAYVWTVCLGTSQQTRQIWTLPVKFIFKLQRIEKEI